MGQISKRFTLRICEQDGQPCCVYVHDAESCEDALIYARKWTDSSFIGCRVELYQGPPEELRGDEHPIAVFRRWQ